MPLDDTDFVSGGLPVPSNIRPSRLFTADAAIVTRIVGRISSKKLLEVLQSLAALLSRP
jgi:mRNA interferase MazF